MNNPRFRVSAGWGGSLTMMLGAAVYRGPGGDAERHAHYAIQVVASADEPFVLELGDCTVRDHLAVVPSGSVHRLECSSTRFALVLIEPSGVLGEALDALVRNATAEVIARTLMPPMRELIDDHAHHAASIEGLERALGFAGRKRLAAPSLPVRAALQYIEDCVEATPRLVDAARAAHVSASYLTHLFTREVGIPFRRYVLWVRLRHCTEHVIDGLNLTEAATAAGFSDSAHFSRAFKKHVGLNPSALRRMELRQVPRSACRTCT